MAQGDINDTTKMLMDIKEDVAATKAKVEDIESKLNRIDDIDSKADKALAKSIEAEHEIDRVTTIQNWLIGILFSGVAITLLVYVAEKFL
ncbi:hemolysin XhlA family protein [Lactiplantibacillus plantarum]|uniref:hemolysin XhlA family protein n=1 Tax=Lactiplantibacillus plantarum TaxID=1590 RepID=UPI0009753C62|nr:hemolysin XhlA family protein [Lactiplantibacillus plantarum]AVH85833.1 hypothetical protein [Lactobacillus phage PM411]PKX64416.1 holin [Lactiplantibacillus plantarum]